MSMEVNGCDRTLVVEPRTTLVDALREGCALKGTVAGCSEGVCGSCTLLIDGEPVRSCLVFAVQAHGRAVRTVEGLSHDGALSPLQAAFIEAGAVQCGYCTPGFLMLAEAALARGVRLDDAAIDALVATNLCRCGAQDAIAAAIRAAQASVDPADP